MAADEEPTSLGTMISRFLMISIIAKDHHRHNCHRHIHFPFRLGLLAFAAVDVAIHFFRLGLSLIIVPVVAIIDAAAIAKAFGETDVDADDHHVDAG